MQEVNLLLRCLFIYKNAHFAENQKKEIFLCGVLSVLLSLSLSRRVFVPLSNIAVPYGGYVPLAQGSILMCLCTIAESS